MCYYTSCWGWVVKNKWTKKKNQKKNLLALPATHFLEFTFWSGGQRTYKRKISYTLEVNFFEEN